MNDRIGKIKGSASAGLMEKVQELKLQKKDIIGLAGGEPDFDTPDRVRFRGMQSIAEGNTHYAVGKGILPLRKRIVKKLQEENGIQCSPDEIIVTPGGKYATYLAVRAVVQESDKVMILDPSWVSYAPIVESANGIPVSVALSYDNNYRITKEILEDSYDESVKLLIINYPNNPTGCILSEEEAKEIVDFMLEHPNLIIFSDEIYEKIIFDGNKHISIGSYKEIAQRVITMNGFSKCVAMTGWRLGYLRADISISNVIYKLYTHTITGTSPFIQEAAIVALDCNEEIEEMRAIYEKRRDVFIDGLNQIKNVSAVKPKGAFYAWVKIEKNNMNSFEIAEYLLKKVGVVGVPGDEYGFGGEKCIRFSFANRVEDLEEALIRIRSALEDNE